MSADVTALVTAVRGGEPHALAALADMCLERGDAHFIADVLSQVRRSVPAETTLLAVAGLFTVSPGVLRFLYENFAKRMLCDPGKLMVNRAAYASGYYEAVDEEYLHSVANKATIADLVKHSGKELLGKNGGVQGFGKKGLEELVAVLRLLGWDLKQDGK